MKNYLQSFKDFLREAEDPTYYQETFYFTLLISMNKEMGGSRDETKNDIRAIPEILTVTLVEPEKGGVQRDIGSKYLSTLKVHARKPKGVDKRLLMKKLVLLINNLRGISVLRYKEKKPKPRRKAFHGTYKLSEGDYWQSDAHEKEVMRDAAELTTSGGQEHGGAPFDSKKTRRGPWKSAPPGAPGGLEETQLDEVMVGAEGLPEDIVVSVDKSEAPRSYRAFYALKDDPSTPLKAGDLDRMEAGVEVYGNIYAALGQDFPYEGRYVVTSVKALDKYGPLLYDIMMELVGKAGLKPDTESITDDASAVWKYYNTARDDVTTIELGPAGEPLPPGEYETVMPAEHAARPEQSEHLAKAYVKRNRSVLDALKRSGKLADASGSRAPSSREELTDLAAELEIPIVKKDLSRFDRLREDILVSIGAANNDLMAFDIQPDLNQKIWDGETHVRSGVKAALMDVVDEFMEGLDLELDIKDIIITGSIANYNWSRFSDIDIHILVDFAAVNDNEAMVKKFFDAVRSNWNKLHTIMVKGHEVELYVQNEDEPHVSTGVYSLLHDRWLVKPKKVKPELDAGTATKKMLTIAREIDKLSSIYDARRYEDAFKVAERLKEKIKRMRRAGLDESGIYSPENLAFKMLRRSGDIEQLFSIYTQSYDQIYSLDQ